MPSGETNRPWSLAFEFRQHVLPRVAIAGVAGVILAFPATHAEFTALGYPETAVACAFWVAAMMMVTFRRHVGRMLFWLMLLDATLLLYQVSIYTAVMGDYAFLRLGPTLVAAVLFVACSPGRARQQSLLYIVWVGCNIPAFVFGSLQDHVSLTDACVFFALNVFYPLVFYYGNGCLSRASFPRQVLSDSIVASVLVLSCIPLVLIPVELRLRQTASFASLQFGGRAYSVIGVILLAWPILMSNIAKWRSPTRWLAISLIVLVVASSFSRGALAMFFILLVGNLVVGRRHLAPLLGGLAGAVFILALGGILFLSGWFSEAGWFWLLRMNIGSNEAAGLTFNLAQFADTNRVDIWQTALTLFQGSPWWGYGIGSVSSLLASATGDQMSYGGMHNLFLTVLVERGLIGLGGVLALLGRTVWLIAYSKNLPTSRSFMLFSLLVFLSFANGTGVELFQDSSRYINATVTVYLFLLIAFLEYRTTNSPRDQRQHLRASSPVIADT